MVLVVPASQARFVVWVTCLLVMSLAVMVVVRALVESEVVVTMEVA